MQLRVDREASYCVVMGAGELRKFDDPVIVTIDGEEQQVFELSHAARLLLDEWPLQTERRRAAMQAIMRALRDGTPTADARRAFIDAALEVWIFRAG